MVRWRHELNHNCPQYILSKFGPMQAHLRWVTANWFFPSNSLKRFFNGPLMLIVNKHYAIFTNLHYASVNSSCAHPPPPPPGQLRGICTHRQSRGSGISLPKGYPRAFDTRGFWLEIQTKTILSEKTSSLSLIGLSVKDWTKLWRFLKVCFLDFRHFLIVYQATTLKRDRERSLWLCISRSKRIPRVGHLLSSFIPTPGNLPPKTKKVLMPGG